MTLPARQYTDLRQYLDTPEAERAWAVLVPYRQAQRIQQELDRITALEQRLRDQGIQLAQARAKLAEHQAQHRSEHPFRRGW